MQTIATHRLHEFGFAADIAHPRLPEPAPVINVFEGFSHILAWFFTHIWSCIQTLSAIKRAKTGVGYDALTGLLPVPNLSKLSTVFSIFLFTDSEWLSSMGICILIPQKIQSS